MKNRAFFLMLAAVALLSTPAGAAAVFMVQFGSFETREEADARLGELKSKHSGVLSRMQSGIREVTLPPDNLTVYRTQAGPLESREAAQSVCAQLASNGDECYVVQTAMMVPLQPAGAQMAQAQPAPAPAVTSTTTTTTTTAAVPAPAMTPKPLASAMAPSASTTTTTTSTTTTAPDAAPPIAMAPLAARDPQNVAAINRVTGGSQPMTVASAGKPVSPGMEQAMDEAAAEQDTRAAQMAATPPQKERSFWSRLNPFSDEEPAAAPAKVAVAPDQAQAVPVAPVESKQAPIILGTDSQTQAQASAAMPAPMPQPQPTGPINMDAAAPMSALPTATSTTQVITQAPLMNLPPPPPPMSGKGAIGDSTAASLRTPPLVIAPESTGTMSPAPVLAAGSGNVRVGEAQRVPLSQATTPQPPVVVTVPPPTMLTPGAPAVSLRPSATLGQKTLWASVGQFVDAQSALAFWDEYRRTHPDFPVVRVRVSSPLQALQRGYDQVSLRVGPFAKESSIRNLCATIAQNPQAASLRCGPVTDMGISSQINGPRRGYLPGSRYQR